MVVNEVGFASLCAGIAAVICAGFAPASLTPRRVLSATICIAAVLTAAVLCATSAAYDDFGYAVEPRLHGWWQFQVTHYLTWTGRYFATMYMSTWPYTGLLDTWVYQVLSILGWLLSIAGIGLLAWQLLPERWDRHVRQIITGLVVGLCIATWPAFADGVAWMPGACSYVWPLGMLAWGCWLITAHASAHRWAGILGLGCCALSCGGSEINVIATGLLVGALGVRDHLTGQGLHRWWTTTLVAVLIAGTCNVASPGANARHVETVRQGFQQLSVSQALHFSLQNAVMFFAERLSSAAWVAGLAACTWCAWIANAAVRLRVPGYVVAAAPAAVVATYVLLEFPMSYGHGIGPPGRAFNIIATGTTLCALTSAVLFGAWMPVGWVMRRGQSTLDRARAMSSRTRTLLVLAGCGLLGGLCILEILDPLHGFGLIGVILALVYLRSADAGRRFQVTICATCVAMLTSPTLMTIAWDIRLVPHQVRAVAERRQIIASARPDSDVVVPMWDPDATPFSAVSYDITRSRSDNEKTAIFYGVRSIINTTRDRYDLMRASDHR